VPTTSHLVKRAKQVRKMSILKKNCQNVVKKLSEKNVKKFSKKCSKSCLIYQKVKCKKTKILKRVGEEEEGEEGEEGEGEGDL
jgi:hypothetical protein